MDYSHLNSAQVRVQSIKEDLKNHDLDHLQSFLQGVSDPEPPNYCKMHGKVEPKLEKVTLKEGANIYNIGNVLFSSDNTVHRVYFAVEKGEIEAYFEAPLPKDSGNPLSLPILDSILMDLLPLWGMKFSAIRRRMTQINDVRAFANNAPNQPEQHLSYGKNISKMRACSANLSADSNGTNTRKRGNGELVPRHPANKRKCIGLESIPDSVKSKAFARIPEEFKLGLFNMIAHVAFPNFDNVVMAAWNVISIYEHVGTEFPEFHKAIVELKSVLQDFDVTYRKERLQTRAKKEDSQEPHKQSRSSSHVEKAHSDLYHEETPQVISVIDDLQKSRQPGQEESNDRNDLRHDELQVPTNETLSSNLISPKLCNEYRSASVSTTGEGLATNNDFNASETQSSLQPIQQPRVTPKSKHSGPIMNDEARKRECVARLKESRQQLFQLTREQSSQDGHIEASSPKSTLEEQHSRNRIPIENGRIDTNPNSLRMGKTFGPSRFSQVDIIDFTKEDQYEIPRSNGGRTHNSNRNAQHANNGSVFLGQSKLGRPKGTFNTPGVAPEAPMLHTVKKDQHDTRDRHS